MLGTEAKLTKIYLPCRNLEATRAFYCRALGDNQVNGHRVQLGSASLELVAADGPVGSARATRLVLEVDDVAAVLQRFELPPDADGAPIQDPDGRSITLRPRSSLSAGQRFLLQLVLVTIAAVLLVLWLLPG